MERKDNTLSYLFISLSLSLLIHSIIVLIPYIKKHQLKDGVISAKNIKALKINPKKNKKNLFISLPISNLSEQVSNPKEDFIHPPPDIEYKILKLIYGKIFPIWKESTPPEPGKVKVRLYLNSSGDLCNMEVLNNTGSSNLKNFVLSLIKKAAPFKEINQYTQKGIVVDCVFMIM